MLAMVDPDLVCLKITSAPSDARAIDLSQFLKNWASNGTIDDLRAAENAHGSYCGIYYAKFHYTGDKPELPSLISKQAFDRSHIHGPIIPASEYPGPINPNTLPRAPMFFEFVDCPFPFHPNYLRPEQLARRGAPFSKVSDDYFRFLRAGGQKRNFVCKSSADSIKAGR
jgi:hypothetical protein